MRNGGRTGISKLNLIRKPYRSLLNGGHGYASFDFDTASSLVERLAGGAPILDPMSGYGSLLDICSNKGIPSVSVEISAPLHLWQLIKKPDLSDMFIMAINELLARSKDWPKAGKLADTSNQWFTEEALNILDRLVQLNCEILEATCASSQIKTEIMAAALIVPFCGRMSCYTESENNPTWVKQGGIVIYKDWECDYNEYLIALRSLLNGNTNVSSRQVAHRVILGDCRLIDFNHAGLRALLTSPPYPNRTDYFSMFEPEVFFCSHLNIPDLIIAPSTQYLGSTVVKGTTQKRDSLTVVDEFLNYVQSSKSKRKVGRSDNITYYYPYFANYFHGLHDAYANVSHATAPDFRGYIIIQNNHFRDREVPVAQAVTEIWHALGFKVNTVDQTEVFHMGTKNPRARGIKAKQSLYTLEILK